MISDTAAFSIAQDQFDNCRSGYMSYQLNYKTSNFEIYWEVELAFVKKSDGNLHFYVKQTEDTSLVEYVYFKDTLLVFAEGATENFYSKEYSEKPFEGNVRRAYTYLLSEHVLTNFLTYKNVSIYDTILPENKGNVIVGESSTIVTDSPLIGHYKSKIVLDSNNNLVSCFNQVLAYRDTSLFHAAYKEYVIDSVVLYPVKDQNIESKIMAKYFELDSIITPNYKEKKDTIKVKSLEIPKYAINWRLPLTNGDTLDSKKIKSKIVVVDFYYMGCGPCVLGIYDLVELDNYYDESDVTFVGVNVVDKDIAKINKFIKEKGIKYKNVIDTKGLSNRYGFNSFPQILIIETKSNKILYHFSGYRSDGHTYYKRLIDSLLGV